MSNKVTIQEALRLIEADQFPAGRAVSFDEGQGVEAIDAIKLGAAGVDVPDGLIYYDDESTTEDESFDGPWEAIDSDLEEEQKYLRLEMKVDPKIKEWIDANDIDISLLVSKLVEDAYETSQLIEK